MTSACPLYDPQMEHESCGVGAVIDLRAQATHRTVSDALTIVERLAHRAGSDATGTTGDGVDIGRGEMIISGSPVGTLSYGNGDTIGLAVSGGQATAYVNGVQAATAPVPEGALGGDYAGIIAANPTTHEWDDFVIAEMPG